MAFSYADILGRSNLRNIATDFDGWDRDYRRIKQAWLDACPLTRTTTIYIGQDAAGDSSGGAGSGTSGDPYLVDTLNDLSTLIADMLAGTHGSTDLSGGDAQILLRAGDTFAWDGTLTDIQNPGGNPTHFAIDLTVDNITLGSFGRDRVNRPKIVGWVASKDIAPGSAWTQDATHTDTYYASTTDSIAWAGIKDSTFDWPLLKRFDSVSALSGGSWGWHLDTANDRLYVKLAGGDPDAMDLTVQVTLDNSIGAIAIRDADGCRVHGIDVEAMGMLTSSPNNQADAIKVRVTDDQVGVVTNCRAKIGAGHLIAYHAPGGSDSGGRALFLDCDARYGLLDGTTVYNAYATNGDMEAIWERCTAGPGMLPSEGQTSISGSPFFAHTGGSGTQSGLMIRRNCRIEYAPNESQYVNRGGMDPPTASTLDDAKVFVVGELLEGGCERDQVAFADTVHYGCDLTIHGGDGAGSNFIANSAQTGWLMNSIIRVIPYALPNANSFFVNADGSNARLWHNHFHLVDRGFGTWHFWESDFGDMSEPDAVNNIFTAEGLAGNNTSLGMLDSSDVLKSNAYGPSVLPGDYSNDSGAVVLTEERTPGQSPAEGDELVAGSSAVLLSHDMLGRERVGTPVIGPLVAVDTEVVTSEAGGTARRRGGPLRSTAAGGTASVNR